MKENPFLWPAASAGFKQSESGSLEKGTGEEDDLPLRGELFSAQQMEQHGRALAASHELSKRGGGDRLLARLSENEVLLGATCEGLTAAVKEGRQVTPASEWLLDNFYLIEDQIRTARRHLPKDYSKELPRLAKGAPEGTPRVYQIALEIIAHGDGRVDPESLSRFVEAYQEVATLKLGELWAIPIMLRLALIENLRRVAARVAENRFQRDLANSWADQMVEIADKNPSGLILLVADMARSEPPITSGFVAELARRLQGQSPVLTLALNWITYRLAESGQTIEQQIQAEIHLQAAEQVSIANSIGSLRFLGTMDWQEFVETMSVVEQSLREDPAGTYPDMDFSTRDQYRHSVERMARYSRATEAEVAQQALELARARAADQDTRLHHVGYYLVGDGMLLLERQVGVRLPPLRSLKRTMRTSPLLSYLGAIGALSVIATALMLERAWRDGVQPWALLVLGILALMGSSQLALALVNWVATLFVEPRPLPRMDFRHGIPPDARTVVAVPALLYSRENVDELCEQLEVRFLANRDPNLRFCLLTDFADAQEETQPADAALTERAAANIARLNLKYTEQDAAAPFLLLHRPRRWNAAQRAWMGEERKRGKLSDLNRFMRGGAQDAFSLIVGEIEDLPAFKYVITLDSDTQLPRDAARQFVATMRHPLNLPRIDQRLRRVVAGYGILQPRVAVSLPSEDASRYEKLCGGEPGIDPYTRTVSDVYQDVFAEGSFIGKGIYDVDVFEEVLGRRLPQNRILSHDLLEGCYLRAGLLSDGQLYEHYPARYRDDVSRRQRWIRGDWQLLPWLMQRVPLAGGKHERNPLSALSRWKLFDNLRRSLVAPVLTLSLLMAFAALPHPWFWACAVLAIIFLPPLASAIHDLLHKPDDTLWSQHAPASLRRSGMQFAHALLTLVFLPYEAYVSLDAIVRTGWRLLVSRRRLLEWRASGLSHAGTSLASNWRTMWIAPLLALGAGAGLAALRPQAVEAALIFVAAWFVSPMVAWWISLPIARVQRALKEDQNLFLHKLSRKTWLWFETFVGPEDNWLPPDNMQEHPTQVVAHRTSPTNMGMALLANLTAYDFAYISGAQLVARTASTLDSMSQLERHQGHFYNWYDTQSMKPLHPIYISTVDSGNLAGHLLTLQAGLVGIAELPIVHPNLAQGLATTCALLREAAATAGSVAADSLAALEAAIAAPPPDYPPSLRQQRAWLLRACEGAELFLRQASVPLDPQVAAWAGALHAQCRSLLDELDGFAPWITAQADAQYDTTLDRVPTLRELASWPLPGAVPSDLAPDERERQQQLATLVEQGAARARAARHAEPSVAPGQRIRPVRVRLPVQPDHQAAGHRLQPERAAAGCELLRLAGLRSAAGQLCRHRARTTAAGALVRHGAPALHSARPTGAAVLERLDVRVPDAAAGDADLPEHLAGPDLPVGGGGAGGIR